MTLEEQQDMAYKFGEKLAKKHGARDMGSPPLDKILALVGGTNLEEDDAETIFERYETGYYDKKWKITHENIN